MTEDTISRQAALRALEECIEARLEWNSDSREERQGLNVAICVIEDLPSAQTNLQPTCNQLATDCISRQAALKAIQDLYPAIPRIKFGDNIRDWQQKNRQYIDCENVIRSLPSAERKGHWKITDAYPHNVYCSECHERFAQTHWAVWEDGSLPRAYCPNCGARMEAE